MASLAQPDQFFTAQFDFAPLRRTFEALAQRVESLESTCTALQEKNADLTDKIGLATTRAEKSQKQFEALYEVVGTLNSNFSGMQSNFIGREEVQAKVKSTVALIDAVNARCDDLYEKKMDARSVALENRVKEIAHETSSRHISVRDKEQREWFTLHMSDAETKLTELILTTQRDIRGHLEHELDVLRRGATDLQSSLQQAQRDFDQNVQVLVGLDKAFVSKLETHERHLETAEAGAQREVDVVRRTVKAVLNAFGMDIPRLMAATHDGELFEDSEDAQRYFHRGVGAAQRTHENAKGWRVVKALHPSVGAALAVEIPDEAAVDLRPHELRRDERLRIAEHRSRALAERLTNVDAQIPLSKAGRAILGAPLFIQVREDAVAQFTGGMQAAHKELAQDFASQVQNLQRDLRAKIGSQRVVELIEQYAAEMVKAETAKFAREIERVSEGMMHREDILTALTGKADARALTYKADLSMVAASVDHLETKVNESRENLTARFMASLDAKAKELGSAKLDRRDPTYLSIVNLVQSGQAFNAPSVAAAGDRCVSCGVVPGSAAEAASVAGTPTRATRESDEHRRDSEAARMQVVQDRIHSTQMAAPPAMGASSPRGGSRPGSASVGGARGGPPAGDWVQLMDSKFKGRMLVPAPPAPSKQQPASSGTSSPKR